MHNKTRNTYYGSKQGTFSFHVDFTGQNPEAWTFGAWSSVISEENSPSQRMCTDGTAVGWSPGWNADLQPLSALHRFQNTPAVANLCVSFLNLQLDCTATLRRKTDNISVRQQCVNISQTRFQHSLSEAFQGSFWDLKTKSSETLSSHC